MAIKTIYICDISGFQSENKADFVQVKIISSGYYYDTSPISSCVNLPREYSPYTEIKLISIEVANKLNLKGYKKLEDDKVEVTFAERLGTLLQEYIDESLSNN